LRFLEGLFVCLPEKTKALEVGNKVLALPILRFFTVLRMTTMADSVAEAHLK
jgi:hypothetical protein